MFAGIPGPPRAGRPTCSAGNHATSPGLVVHPRAWDPVLAGPRFSASSGDFPQPSPVCGLGALCGSNILLWPYLVRKVSWLTQEVARQAADGVEVPTLVPEVRDQPRSPNLDAPIQVVPHRGVRDPRLPRSGTEVVKVYRGPRLVVMVREDGFEWNGRPYRSLTAVAKVVTGQPFINGKLFFGLTARQRGKKKVERSASLP